MYYISMVDTAVLGVLGGICIVVGVVGAFFTAGATLPIAGVGCVLGGAAISSHSYTKTLDSDRSAGRDRSWSQFYLERTVKEFQGAAAGAVVFAGLLAGADLIAAAGRISSSIPSIVTAGTSGGTMAGQKVTRKYVKNQDELLQKAEEAAGGSLDNFEEIKPGWYQNEEGTIKIEWNPEGHANTNEEPHVTIRHRNERGGWSIVEKYFIEGCDYY